MAGPSSMFGDPRAGFDFNQTRPADFTGTFSPGNPWEQAPYQQDYNSPYVVTGPTQADTSMSDIEKFLAEYLAELNNGGGGGGGGGYSDPYAGDYLNLAQNKFAFEKDSEYWNRSRTDALDKWNMAMDDRDFALASGDLALAQKKQDDANYWKSVDNQIAQRQAAADRASAEAQTAMSANASMFGSAAGANASMFGASTSAKARIAEAEIQAAVARQNSENNLRVGLANARNDEERNAIVKAWNEDQAAIARMEDETRRDIASAQLGIDRFGAETDRFSEYSQAQQRENELIAELARSPRDLFGSFFLQRGITPDFDAIAQGNAQVGDPLRASSAMSAFTPQYGLPDDLSLQNSESGNVGAASAGLQLNPNQFIQGGTGLGNDGGFVWQPGQTDTSQFDYTPISAPTVSGGSGAAAGGIINAAAPSSAIQKPLVDVNPGGKIGGVPVAALKPGMNLATVGGPDITGANFTFPAFYDQGRTRPIGPTDLVQGGSQVWVDYPGGGGNSIQIDAGSGNSGGGRLNSVIQANDGGMVDDPLSIVGDARGSNPKAGGAKPEMLINPTGAPFGIVKTEDLDFGRSNGNSVPVHADGAGLAELLKMILSNQQGNSAMAGGRQQQPQFNNEVVGNVGNRQMQGGRTSNPAMANPGMDFRGNEQMRPGIAQILQMLMGGLPQRNDGTGREMRRYATGTGNFGASLYTPESPNTHLQGRTDLPYWMQILMDNNVPLPPALVASVTGNSPGQNNFANAFTARGGGVLPSLQTLGNQTQGETELFKGYTEGPVGLSATDAFDFIAKPTSNLKTAQTSRGGTFGY